jgi:hypothetical protein
MFGGTNGNCTLGAIQGILDQINQRKIEYMQKFESPNFSFRVYKKGTVHLYFKDLKALEMINRYAAERQMFSFLRRHGINPASAAELLRLFQEGNALTAGKRRNIWSAPIYSWEVRYGKWSYQVGPAGCAKALTKDEGDKLSQIDRRLRVLLNDYTFDPHAMTFDIPCKVVGGTCHRCLHEHNYPPFGL